ncbi:MAG: hypothetical protein K5769_05340 [Pseudobutyrivibrio sp.]|nr:hypothetical protein [Pseudobutyrivibrio sp.]
MTVTVMVGCGQHANNATVTNHTGSALKKEVAVQETATNTGDEGAEAVDEFAGELFILEELDMTEETLSLYQISTGKQLRYKYNMTTRFLDKYGKNSTWAEFTIGSVVNISGFLPSSGALKQIQKADDVWLLDDISKFKIDESKHLIEINGSNYKLTDDTKIYSDDEKILPSAISKDDVITVIGKDKNVISIAVTTGHGYIQIKNTELFDDSMIFIGNKIASMIHGEKIIEVPEGDYKITVANNGWGGSGEYTVLRNQTTEVDLDALKGSGPSYCLITFLVTVPDTYVYIDGELIDVQEPQSVQYGHHKLMVQSQGYKSWNKTLVVNSESATITLVMEADDGAPAEEAEQEAQSDETQNSEAETPSENTSSDTSESSNEDNSDEEKEESAGSSIKDDYDYEVDYLSTIADLISDLRD